MSAGYLLQTALRREVSRRRRGPRRQPPTHGALRAVRYAPSVQRRWPALPARTPTEPRPAGHAAECDTTCVHKRKLVPPRPHGLAHSPGSCSLLSLDRLRRTAVIAAEDFSDPALNADLDKPKTLLPHSDVEPSSMMLQPAGEGEPTRMPAAAVQLAPACLLTVCSHGAPLQACPSGCRATCSSRSPTSGRRCST